MTFGINGNGLVVSAAACATAAVLLLSGCATPATGEATESRDEADAEALFGAARELQDVENWSKKLHREPIPTGEAMAAYQKVIELHPNTAAARKARLGIADIRRDAGDTAQALVLYREMADQLPHTPEGLEAFARIIDDRFEQNELTEAMGMAEKYLADPKAPARDQMLLKSVLVAFKLQDLAKARSFAEQLIREHPESKCASTARKILARIYNRLDLPADAIPPIPAPTQKDAVAAKALAAENSLRAVKELAAAREFLKNKDGVQAAIRLQRILNVSPDLDPEVAAEAQYLMGEIYRESKNVGSAYISYKKVTWDYPESTWAKSANARLAEREFQKVDAQDGKKAPPVRPVAP